MSVIPERASEQATKTSKNGYMKFIGTNSRFRVLGEAVDGFIWWTDEDGKRRPNRVRDLSEVPERFKDNVAEDDERSKYFIAMLVWNYKFEKDDDGKWVGKAQILDLTQVSIYGVLSSLEVNEDWGDLKGYDIKVEKSGEGKNTRYEVTPVPHKPFDDKDKDIPTVNLKALFDGADPYDVETIDVGDENHVDEVAVDDDIDLDDIAEKLGEDL